MGNRAGHDPFHSQPVNPNMQADYRDRGASNYPVQPGNNNPNTVILQPGSQGAPGTVYGAGIAGAS
jgi:hypothetical protein